MPLGRHLRLQQLGPCAGRAHCSTLALEQQMKSSFFFYFEEVVMFIVESEL